MGNGAPNRVRTCNRPISSRLLYPFELPGPTVISHPHCWTVSALCGASGLLAATAAFFFRLLLGASLYQFNEIDCWQYELAVLRSAGCLPYETPYDAVQNGRGLSREYSSRDRIENSLT